jgi:hypothetical protein
VLRGRWQPAYAPWVQALGAYADGTRPERLRELAGESSASLAEILPWLRPASHDSRERLERGLPGAAAQSVIDAETFFGQELPVVFAWSIGPEEAARVTQPTLAVLGELSSPVFRERRLRAVRRTACPLPLRCH